MINYFLFDDKEKKEIPAYLDFEISNFFIQLFFGRYL